MKFKFYALKLSGILILIFLVQILFPSFTSFFVLNSRAIGELELWRFLSPIFLHGDIAHLLYNLFALALFGSILERLIGERRFLIIFFVTGILANLFSINFYASSLGASGAIFGVIGALIIVRPLLPIWAFGLPMPIFIAGLLWMGGDLIGAAAFLSGQPMNNTGNLAHLSGMFFGFLMGIIYREWKIKERRNKFEVDEHSVREWERDWLG